MVHADDLRERTARRSSSRRRPTFTRGYDPMTGKELWKLLGQLRDRDPDADRRPGLRRSSPTATAACSRSSRSSRARPATSRSRRDETTSEFIAWSIDRGGPYIPTPVIYGDQLYVLQNSGVLAGLQGRDRRADLSGAPRRHRRLVQRVAGRRRRQDLSARAKTATSSSSRRGPTYELAREERDRRGADGVTPPFRTGCSSSAG